MNNVGFDGFKPSTISFLQKLSENNNRNWFMQNKQHYETDVLTPALNYKIREYIVEHPKKWLVARDDKQFRKEFHLYGEKLKLAPRGFPKDHILIEDLRWKDFIVVQNLNKSDIQNDDFIELSSRLFRTATPYMKFLCNAIGVPY
jgi:uncharacterized protein (TIGR02453 family)